MTFYAYIYRDPSRKNEPIYVGKGSNRRAWRHLNRTDRHPFTQRLQKMKNMGVYPVIEIIESIDETHAFFLEECLISVFGRKDTKAGTLLNLTDGGEGPSNPPEHVRQLIGAANKGRKRTTEQIEANRNARLGVPTGRKGKPNPRKNFDKEHGNIGKIRTEDFKNNLSELHTGKTAWNKGQPSRKICCMKCKKEYDPGNFSKHKSIVCI